MSTTPAVNHSETMVIDCNRRPASEFGHLMSEVVSRYVIPMASHDIVVENISVKYLSDRQGDLIDKITIKFRRAFDSDSHTARNVQADALPLDEHIAAILQNAVKEIANGNGDREKRQKDVDNALKGLESITVNGKSAPIPKEIEVPPSTKSGTKATKKKLPDDRLHGIDFARGLQIGDKTYRLHGQVMEKFQMMPPVGAPVLEDDDAARSPLNQDFQLSVLKQFRRTLEQAICLLEDPAPNIAPLDGR